MSDTKAFRFKGDDDDWKLFVAQCKKNGDSAQDELSNFVQRKADALKHENKDDEKTASRHQGDLTNIILNEDLSKVIMNGTYHITLDKPEHLDFIQTARHELSDRVRDAVKDAIYTFYIRKWARLRGIEEKQADVYYCQHDGARNLYNHLWC